MLCAANISKTIGTNQLLSDISLQIRPGKATAVLGPNGAGKSTLLRALGFVDPPTDGELRLDDQVYRFGPTKTELVPTPWPRVTIVFQQLFLWPHLTLRENILLPLRKRGDSASGLAGLAREFDMERILDRHPNEVSGGERQRAAIIRAVLLRPSYLLLDEATASLDIEHSQKAFELLLRLKEEGVGIGFVTHLLGFAQRIADDVVFLDRGRLVEAGPPEILLRPTTERMQRFVSLLEFGTTIS